MTATIKDIKNQITKLSKDILEIKKTEFVDLRYEVVESLVEQLKVDKK